MSDPRGYEKKQSTKARQPVFIGDKQVTVDLDGTTTTETLQLGMVAEKVTVQSTGTLAGNIEVSANGINFVSAGTFAAGTPVTYTSHLCVAVRITRTSGAGKASVLAV
jgi:hypothetical protein